MKVTNKNLRMPSSKDIKEDSGELKKRVETLERHLERKEELLKKMTDMKRESDG